MEWILDLRCSESTLFEYIPSFKRQMYYSEMLFIIDGFVPYEEEEINWDGPLCPFFWRMSITLSSFEFMMIIGRMSSD